MRLVAFCEAPADFRITSDLVDRTLREYGPDWLADLLDSAPEEVRSWKADGRGRPFFVFSDVKNVAGELRVRKPQGHFDGQPGALDALMGMTALSIVRALMDGGDAIDGVLLIRDMDDRPEREIGLGQARTKAQTWTSAPIILGCANPKREAWVLCGFDPETDNEHASLRTLRQELGFLPSERAHELDAKDEQAKRSAKRVLRVLVGDDRDREARCWKETPLDTLRARGRSTGLHAFLVELQEHLLPLVTRR
jgi:hypothetical protein